MDITRREAVIKMAVLMGATLVGPRLFAANFGGVAPTDPSQEFTAEEVALLDEIGDTIIPPTDVPGAKAVGIGAFIGMMVRDCYTLHDQAAFKAGLEKVSTAYTARFGGDFLTGNLADRTTLLNELDREQKLYTAQQTQNNLGAAPEKEIPPHYFRMMKELTLLGYFTSEVGCTQALSYIETPGRYDGGAPHQPGNHDWYLL